MSDHMPTEEEIREAVCGDGLAIDPEAFARWLALTRECAWDEATEDVATWIEGGTSRNYGARYRGRWDSLLLSIVDGIRKARNPYREDEHEI